MIIAFLKYVSENKKHLGNNDTQFLEYAINLYVCQCRSPMYYKNNEGEKSGSNEYFNSISLQ